MIKPPTISTGQPLPAAVQYRVVAAVAGVVVLVILVRLGVSLLGHRGPPPEEPAAAGFFRPTEEQWQGLTLAPVRTEHFPTAVEADGKIAVDDDRTTPVFSPYSGRVTQLFAKAGDRVDKGAPLLAIAGAEFVQGQNDLITAASALELARAQVELARTNEARQESLYEARGAALKDLQQSRVDLASAESAARTAEISLAAVRNRLRILGMDDARIDEIARSHQIETLSAEATVRAPIAGTVTQRQVGLGQNIVSAASGASGPVFTIGDTSKVWLLATVREEDAPAMRVGEPVEGRVLAFGPRVFTGRLNFVAPGLDPATHRLFVHAEVDNPDGVLKPEMFAEFTIITGPERAAPGVPAEAVIYEGASARVWVARPDRTLGLREIRTGATRGGRVEVLSGLAAGESVVATGSLFIDRAAHSE